MAANIVFMGYAPVDTTGRKGFLGYRVSGGAGATAPHSTNTTNSFNASKFVPELRKQSARALTGPSSTSANPGGESSTSFLTTKLTPEARNQVARPMTGPSAAAWGSEPAARSAEVPLAPLGPTYVGGQKNLVYLGYMAYATSSISRSLSQAPSLTHSAAVQKEANRSLSHTLGATDSAVPEVIKNLSHSLTVSNSVTVLREVNQSLSDTLSLTHSITSEGSGHAEDTISLTHLASAVVDRAQNLTHTLTTTDTAVGIKDVPRSLSDTLGTTDSVQQQRFTNASASSTLGLTDAVQVETTFTLSNSLALSQAVFGFKTHSESLTQSAATTQIVAHNFRSFSLTGTLAMTQVADSDLKERTLTQALALTQSVTPRLDRVSVSQTLSTLTHAVAVRGPILRSVSSALAMTHAVAAVPDSFALSHVLSITHTASANIYTRSLLHTLSMTHSVSRQHVRTVERSLADNLALTQVVLTPGAMFASDTLGLGQVLSHRLDTLHALSHNVGLTHSVTSVDSTYSLIVSDALGLSQAVSRNQDDQDVSDTLTLTQAAAANKGYDQNLALTQGATVQVVKALSHTLAITDSVVVIKDKRLTNSQSLGLGQAVQVQVIRAPAVPYVGNDGTNSHPTPACKTQHKYDPQVAPGSTFPTTQPTVTPRSTILLKWPYASPTNTLELRRPEYENGEKQSYDRVVRESRGGTLQVFRDGSWPKSRRLNFEVLLLKKADAEQCFGFLDQSLGQEVELTDHLSRLWRGVVFPVESGVVQNSRGRRTLELEFEGELVS